jgi:hypothetical protein
MKTCPRCLGCKKAIVQEGRDWHWTTCPLCSGRGKLTDEEAAAVQKIVDMVNAFAVKAEKKLLDGLTRYAE